MQALSTPKVQASARKWPDLFSKGEVQAKEAQVEGKMRTVRPVVETGWGCGFHRWLSWNSGELLIPQTGGTSAPSCAISKVLGY